MLIARPLSEALSTLVESDASSRCKTAVLIKGLYESRVLCFADPDGRTEPLVKVDADGETYIEAFTSVPSNFAGATAATKMFDCPGEALCRFVIKHHVKTLVLNSNGPVVARLDQSTLAAFDWAGLRG